MKYGKYNFMLRFFVTCCMYSTNVLKPFTTPKCAVKPDMTEHITTEK